MNVEDKIILFMKNSTESTTAATQKEMNEYSDKLKNQIQEYRKKKEKVSQQHIKTTKTLIKNSYSKEYTSAIWNQKSLLSQKRVTLRNLLFSDVVKKLIEHKKNESYIDEMNNFIREIKDITKNAEVTYYLNADDIFLKDKLNFPKNAKIEQSTTDFIGGIKAVIHGKNILINKSYAELLEEQKNSFYYEIGDGIFI